MNVFVSHAIPDQQLALALAAMLKSGAGVVDIFCSSSKGTIPNGQFFVQHILTNLKAANCTICLLSPNYFESQFCIAELGSAMAAQFDGSAIFNSFIIPPTHFTDLSGILVGVQSEALEDTAALNGLCARLGGDVSEPRWGAARDLFQGTIKPIVDRRQAETLLAKIIVHDFLIHATSAPNVSYKSKIRVQLKNTSGEQIEVSYPGWCAGGADVPQQLPQHGPDVLQLEGTPGWHKDVWEPLASKISVPSNGVFRLWIGLHQAFSPDELRRRHEGQLLGTLALKIRIRKVDLTWTRRL